MRDRLPPRVRGQTAWPRLAGQVRSVGIVRRAFSLVELLVVLSVAMVMTGLMLPALSQVRENVNRIICSSNMRQLGLAFELYSRDHGGRLPYSELLRVDQLPLELMAAHSGKRFDGWDGHGLLFKEQYCSAPECYYCPSHKGEHFIDRYQEFWPMPINGTRLYTNYHYGGDVEWDDRDRMRRRDLNDGMVLITDGLRTRSDFNHGSGMNILRGDGSVRWRDDGQGFAQDLPAEEPTGDQSGYEHLWSELEDLAR